MFVRILELAVGVGEEALGGVVAAPASRGTVIIRLLRWRPRPRLLLHPLLRSIFATHARSLAGTFPLLLLLQCVLSRIPHFCRPLQNVSKGRDYMGVARLKKGVDPSRPF